MTVIIMDLTVSGSKAPSIHSSVATPSREAHQETDEEAKEGGRGVEHDLDGPVELRHGLEVALLLEVPDDARGALGRLFLVGLYVELGRDGRLVGVGDAGELRDHTPKGLLVEALDVPVGANVERRVHEDLYKALAHVAPHLVPNLLERRDGRDDHADVVAREQVRHEPDPQHVRVPVLAAEAEALGEIRPHDVPVENLDLAVPHPELPLDDLRDGRLARPRKAGEP